MSLYTFNKQDSYDDGSSYQHSPLYVPPPDLSEPPHLLLMFSVVLADKDADAILASLRAAKVDQNFVDRIEQGILYARSNPYRGR